MKKFSTSFNGYSKAEVNEFLNKVTKEYESMLNRLKSTDQEVETLKIKIAEYQNLETTLRRTLLVAEDTNNQLRRVAKNESIAMMEDAKKNASRIVNDALIKAGKVEADADALKRRVIMYKRRVKQTIEEQLEMVDQIDDIEY